VIKSIKLRIYPNKTQLKIINDTLGACNFVKNKFLAYNLKNRDEGRKFTDGYKFSKIINKLKKEDDKYSWLDDISSKSIKDAIMSKEKAYKAFFKNNKGFPRFKSRKRINKESYFFIKDNIHYIGKNIIKLPILKKVRITNSKDLPDKGSITSGRIIRHYDKYYVMFIYNDEYNDNKDIIKNNIKLGIDLGIKEYAILYDGYNYFHFKHFKELISYNKLNGRLDKLQKVVSKKAEYNYGKLLNLYLDKYHKEPSEIEKNKMKGKSYNSSKIRKVFNKINKIRVKLTNIKDNFIKQLVNYLTAIVKPKKINIEDLDISRMIRDKDTSHSLHRYTAESCFYKFRIHLINKCKEYDIKIRLVNTYYPSTQICSKCGKKNKLKLEDRTFVCKKCGMTMDRDENAAINIYNCKYYEEIA
jgi:putative transposase